MKKVVVAMSGGVDSSVTAAILKEKGYDVLGVSMQLFTQEGHFNDARLSAEILGIPHRLIDLRERFQIEVIDHFTTQYINGRTPNPCVRCNQHIKFGFLLREAMRIGADFIATGHYARIVSSHEHGRYLLKKGLDERKDQSYFLYTLTQEQLKRTLMPLGNRRKPEVREIAQNLGLPVAQRPESQEICFIPANNYRTFFLQRGIISPPGTIVNRNGKELGQHRGIFHYTIGQRRGLGIPGTEPYYVTQIQYEKNRVVVGNRWEAFFNELVAHEVNWIIKPPEKPMEIFAKIRSAHTAAPARLIPLSGESVRVIFSSPQWAITPGQAVVFYQGDITLGGGTIEQAA